MERDYIQKTIDALKSRTAKIEELYTLFKAGEISKLDFEMGYEDIMDKLEHLCHNEYYRPNNGEEYAHLKKDSND